MQDRERQLAHGRAVFERYQLSAAKLGLDAAAPSDECGRGLKRFEWWPLHCNATQLAATRQAAAVAGTPIRKGGLGFVDACVGRALPKLAELTCVDPGARRSGREDCDAVPRLKAALGATVSSEPGCSTDEPT